MKNQIALKVVKIILMVLSVFCFVMVLYFFVRGIGKSLFENDTKVAQNRINSAYYFLKMLIPGLCLLILLAFVYSIKVRVLPQKMAQFLGYKENEEVLHVEEQKESSQEEVNEEKEE